MGSAVILRVSMGMSFLCFLLISEILCFLSERLKNPFAPIIYRQNLGHYIHSIFQPDLSGLAGFSPRPGFWGCELIGRRGREEPLRVKKP
jgi:hypothetical protein